MSEKGRWLELLEAVNTGSLDKVIRVLNDYFPSYCKNNTNVFSSCGDFCANKENPPLHQAILTGSTDVVLVLIEGGISIHDRNKYFETPLHLACRKGREDIVLHLLEKGADIDAKDCADNSPLFNAVTYSHPHIADLLIQRHCQIDSLNEELMSPLDQALLYDQREVITILLQAGCSLKKAIGHVYYDDHYANSVLASLVRNEDSVNIQVLYLCGYSIRKSEIKKLLRSNMTGQQQNNSVKEVLNDLLNTPVSLQDYCRMTIRQHLLSRSPVSVSMHTKLELLDIPKSLKSFLSFRNNS